MVAQTSIFSPTDVAELEARHVMEMVIDFRGVISESLFHSKLLEPAKVRLRVLR